MCKRNRSKDTKRAAKGDARLEVGASRLSGIKAAYAKEIACLKTEIAMLKNRFNYV
jgi:hypothetical protein